MMHHHGSVFNPLLQARDCVSCPAQAPQCNCSSGFECVLTSQYAHFLHNVSITPESISFTLSLRSCSTCSQAQCIPKPTKASSGVSTGALAGAVVGVLAFLFIVVGGFLWWRRRAAQRRAAAVSREKAIENVPGVHPMSPGGAMSPINPRFSRPMPVGEKTPGMENENPFETGSVRSGAPSAQSIPIGFASDGQMSPPALSPTGTTFTGAPVRPARSPDLNIRATPFDKPASGGLAPPRPNYAPSQRTDFTSSTMDSTASSAMEALYESPTIVTGVKRTVIGAGRGEVVPVASVGSGSGPSSPRSNGPARRTLVPGPSPLASSQFTRTELPTTLEEDPFGDNLSLRSQSTAMTNMSFGMGTPTASIRSFAQPTVASRVNVASLTRSATLRSIGAPSIAPTSATHTILEHPLSRESTDLYPPQRPESVQSFASNTDSVLASFPFVPPSPLPSSSSRSPLSVVFTTNGSHRQSAASSMFGSENASLEDAPPLPNTHDIAALNSARGSSQAATAGSSPASTPLPPSLYRYDKPNAPFANGAASNRMAPRASTMSRASGVSSANGLDDFDFEFSPGSEEPMPSVSLAQARSDSVSGALSAGDKASFIDSASSKAATENNNTRDDRSASRASLDLLALSRDLAANKLSYD